MSDKQKAQTYAAEFTLRCDLELTGERLRVFGCEIVIPVERKFGHLEHIESYCNRILARRDVAERFPKAAASPIRVRHRKGEGSAHYSGGVIAIHDPKYGTPGWAMREIVVLHELAHHLVRMDCGYGCDAHGTEFRQAFVYLVNEFIGAEIGWLLGIRFMQEGLPAVVVP